MSDQLDAIVARVREIASGAPDYRYQSTPCANWEYDPAGNKVGSCVIGRALIDLGHPVLDLDPETNVIGALRQLNIGDHWKSDPDLDPRVKWLIDVQDAQDCSIAWGHAVSTADQNQRLSRV